MMKIEWFVGIDVSKLWLDVYVQLGGLVFVVGNDEVGVVEFVDWLWMDEVCLVVLEVIGGLQEWVVVVLVVVGFFVVVVNLCQVCDFVWVMGCLVKIDKFDVVVLVVFVEVVKLELCELVDFE